MNVNKYVYSAKSNAFYPEAMRANYEETNSWPDDGIEMDESDFVSWQNPPSGKRRIADADGRPAWADIPPPTQSELVDAAENEKKSRLAESDAATADWRAELALGIIDDDDKTKLTEWMKYIKAVKAVDTSTAPDVSWPEKPAA